ncbi:hypothetical protein CAPTEDRAFT_192173 [Capitella teleta]|uniref:LRRCT domain-containing protein n=1 Tax=Capitella teleta TaxID=283909 RepID=R7TD69_CAPTE|nr:hypothetical protein CAPTEDRAFT_192173 [Capitella teleta]|eukprot:ELT89432.1 hypothetical protein CAPTEDRAFT_192173 [Capitella teleta]
MSFEFPSVVQVILCLVISKRCHSTTDFTDQGLTSLQQTWPSYHNESTIIASFNSISEISAVDSNCADSPLERLNLKGNIIWRIEADSFRTCQLTYLNLIENKLTSFPNLSNIGDTLEDLHVVSNQIESVSVSDVSYLVELVKLYMGYNRIVSFPDLSYHLPAIQAIGLVDSTFDCCRDYAWLKNAANLTIFLSDEPCSKPGNWVTRSWDSFRYDELLLESCECKDVHGWWRSQSYIVTQEGAIMRDSNPSTSEIWIERSTLYIYRYANQSYIGLYVQHKIVDFWFSLSTRLSRNDDDYMFVDPRKQGKVHIRQMRHTF